MTDLSAAVARVRAYIAVCERGEIEDAPFDAIRALLAAVAPAEPVNGARLGVIASGYGWQVHLETGELYALTAGDMGYEPTGIIIDEDSRPSPRPAAAPAEPVALSNVTKDDVAAYVRSLLAEGAPWAAGCAAVLTSLWSDRCALYAAPAAVAPAEPVAWICDDDLRYLRQDGHATVYEKEQRFALLPECQSFPLYMRAAPAADAPAEPVAWQSLNHPSLFTHLQPTAREIDGFRPLYAAPAADARDAARYRWLRDHGDFGLRNADPDAAIDQAMEQR